MKRIFVLIVVLISAGIMNGVSEAAQAGSDSAMVNQEEEYLKIIDECDKEINKDPQSPAAAGIYYKRARAYYYYDMLSDAMGDLKKAIELNRKFAKAYFARGVIYAKQSEYELAEQDFRKVLELEPQGELGEMAKENLDTLIGVPSDYDPRYEEVPPAPDAGKELPNTDWNY